MLNTRDWTEEQCLTLERMWNEGYSASMSARQMPGRTRNAVIGKVDRLGLRARANKYHTTIYRNTPRRKPRIVCEPKPRKERKTQYQNAKRIAQEAIWLPLENSQPVTTLLARTRKQCAWPLDLPHDIGGHLVCGDPVHPDRVYCTTHCRIAYLPPKQKHSGWRG